MNTVTYALCEDGNVVEVFLNLKACMDAAVDNYAVRSRFEPVTIKRSENGVDTVVSISNPTKPLDTDLLYRDKVLRVILLSSFSLGVDVGELWYKYNRVLPLEHILAKAVMSVGYSEKVRQTEYVYLDSPVLYELNKLTTDMEFTGLPLHAEVLGLVLKYGKEETLNGISTVLSNINRAKSDCEGHAYGFEYVVFTTPCGRHISVRNEDLGWSMDIILPVKKGSANTDLGAISNNLSV